jgi:mRNA interferase MazF
VKRGEIWTVAGGPGHAGRRRLAIIIQSDRFDATPSITICPLTATLVDAEPVRFEIAPSKGNGLRATSQAMVDKIATVPKARLGQRVGHLDRHHFLLLNQHVAVFLGLADQRSIL